jgi:co-chaperonin GroES (HSP10)
MATNINTMKGKPSAIGNRVIVTDMHFGEQTTKSGIVLTDDDGQTRGIYPRWAKVYSTGPDNKDPYEPGHWILVEHGRWTRAFRLDDGNGDNDYRMVETESILAYSEEKPEGISMGAEYSDGEHATIDPSAFIGEQY